MANKQTIEFTFYRDKNYTPVYANGVIFGNSPKGGVILHFYNEWKPLPDKLVYKLAEDQTTGVLSEDKGDADVMSYERHVVSGVVLSHDAVLELKRVLDLYLDEKADHEEAADD